MRWLRPYNDEYRPPANVWLGITVVNQEEADRDIPKLLAVPAAVRFLSMEPLLGPVDLSEHLACMCGHCGGEHLDWMIVGGESGPHARPMHPDWARSLRDQCAAAGVPFMFKQWGEWGSGSRSDDVVADILLDFRGEAAGRVTDVVSMVRPHEMTRFGKKVAGRLLDGIEHNGYPA